MKIRVDANFFQARLVFLCSAYREGVHPLHTYPELSFSLNFSYIHTLLLHVCVILQDFVPLLEAEFLVFLFVLRIRFGDWQDPDQALLFLFYNLRLIDSMLFAPRQYCENALSLFFLSQQLGVSWPANEFLKRVFLTMR